MPRSWVLLLLLLASAPLSAPAESVTVPQNPDAAAVRIPVQLLVPKGRGRFPAVVLLHGCAGPGGAVTQDWAARLVGWGFVVAEPDSFTPRGRTAGTCVDPTFVAEQERATDAFAVVKYLEQRKDVDGERIVAMGHDFGGTAVLAALSEKFGGRAWYLATPEHRFAAGIALYPSCAGDLAPPFVFKSVDPVLILAGTLDDWTPARECQELARVAPKDNNPFTLKIYPGARHGFDSLAPKTHVQEALLGRGATLSGDATARAASIRDVKAFLSANVGSPKR